MLTGFKVVQKTDGINNNSLIRTFKNKLLQNIA